MPLRNFYFCVFVIIISLFISSKTSLKNQIARQVAIQLEKRCLEEPSPERLFQGALAGLASAADNAPYTEYLPPQDKKEYMRDIQGQYAGVGLGNFIKDDLSGEYYFIPFHNSPAAKAGLKFGDRIVSVDSQEVAKLSIVELTGLLRGKENTTVTVRIRPRTSVSDGVSATQPSEQSDSLETVNVPLQETSPQDNKNEPYDVTITRGIIQREVVTGDRLGLDGNWIYTLKDLPEIGYIRVEEFTDVTGKKTIEALDRLERSGISRVILDFRGNPGGFLPDAVAICNELLSSGSPIVETRNRKGVKNRYVARKYPRKRFNVAALIDGDSASASEIVSSALQDAGVAIVVGTRSYGKGTIQEIIELPCDLGILRMTTASFWRPSGAPINRSKNASAEDQWGVVPNPGYEEPVSLIQRFYTSWVRQVRVLEPECKELNANALAFMTQQTNLKLKDYLEERGIKKFETAAELGLDISMINLDDKNSGEVDDPDSSDENSSQFVAFKPKGRAPYFDPQLDRAVDYLSSVDSLTDQSSNATKDALEVKSKSRSDLL